MPGWERWSSWGSWVLVLAGLSGPESSSSLISPWSWLIGAWPVGERGTWCLERHHVAGSSPAELNHRRPHKVDRSKHRLWSLAHLSSSWKPSIKTRRGPFLWVCVCVWARLQVELCKCFLCSLYITFFIRDNSALCSPPRLLL